MSRDTHTDSYATTCAMLVENRISEAIELLSDCLARDPDDGKQWALLGIAQWTAGRVIDSIASLETAMTLAPLGAEARLALALGYEVVRKDEPAKSLLIALYDEDDLPNHVLEPLARALARIDLTEMALDVCRQAARRNPESVDPLRGIAFYLGQLGRGPEEILPVLFKAFHLDPDNFDTRLLLARRLHEYDRSIEAAYLLSVVEIETSRCPSCLNAMREIFLTAGETQNVARCNETLIRCAKDSDSPNSNPIG